jgi:hypothetical protein
MILACAEQGRLRQWGESITEPMTLNLGGVNPALGTADRTIIQPPYPNPALPDHIV